MTKKTTECVDYIDDSNNDNNNAKKDKTPGNPEQIAKRTVVLSTDVNDYDTGEAIHNSNKSNNENYSILKALKPKTARRNKNFKLGNKANLKTI
ncbi:MAG TPA: hypothetical protein VE089_09140 [Nitrososphaeraceae archaeon]|jgi:hypothetical protein|nr:hypothetical protein [Nitrososphaeraceae archaeon]